MQKPFVALPLACLITCNADGQAAPESLARVEVTGSHIKGVAAQDAAPVQVLDRADIRSLGASTLLEVLERLSASTATLTDLNGSSSFATGGTGATLRYLGKQGTLVLLNGRRLPTYPLADFAQVFSSLDVIPADAVERVEVLKIGASAIYGSDAIAGVINVITREQEPGLRLSVMHQQGVQQGKFANHRVALTVGTGRRPPDALSAQGTLEVYHRDGLPSWRAVLPDVNPRLAATSASFGTTTTYAWPGNIIGVGPVPGCQVVEANLCRYDRYAAYEVQPSADRVNALGKLSLLRANGVEVRGELLWSRNRNTYAMPHTTYGLGNDVVWGDPRTGEGLLFKGRGLPAGHPLNPTGQEVELQYTFLDDGATQRLASDQYRALVGVKGDGAAASWELVAGVAGGRTAMDIRGALSDVGFRKEVGDYTAQTLPATFFNQPGGYRIGQQNAPEVLQALFPALGWRGRSQNLFVDGNFNGELGRAAGGPLAYAAGFELRREDLRITPTENIQTGDIVGYGSSTSAGHRLVSAAFAELRVPVTRQWLLTAAARLDKYASVAAHVSPTLQLRFQPTQALALRASVEGGFRAPNLPEIGETTKFGFTNGLRDPKRCDAALALAADLRKQAASTSSATDASLLLTRAELVQQRECSGGAGYFVKRNPELRPESSRSMNLGLVVSPSRTWTATMDYYRIARRDEIGLRPLTSLLANEDALPAGVVQREKDPAKDSTFSAAERVLYGVTAGPLRTVTGTFQNLARTRTSGLDLAVKSEFGAWQGVVSLGVDANYLVNYQEYKVEDAQWGRNLAGRHGFPRWTVQSHVGLRTGAWSHTLHYTMKSAQTLERDIDDAGWDVQGCAQLGVQAPDCKVGRYQRVDYSVAWQASPGLSIDFQVRNLLKRRPPFDVRQFTEFGGGLVPQDREDVMGRLFRLLVEYRWQ